MRVVIVDRNPKNEILKKSASQFVAALYEKTGQYQKAAEAFENYAKSIPKKKNLLASTSTPPLSATE